jgi:hypothetical protein
MYVVCASMVPPSVLQDPKMGWELCRSMRRTREGQVVLPDCPRRKGRVMHPSIPGSSRPGSRGTAGLLRPPRSSWSTSSFD